MAKKKILFVGNLNSIHTLKWINFFAKKKFEIGIVSSQEPNLTEKKVNSNINKFIYNKFSNKYLNLLYILFKIKLSEKKFEKYDIVHIHYLGVLSLISLLFKKKKIISTVWGSDVNKAKTIPLRNFFLQKVLDNSYLITTDAYSMKNTLVKKYRIKKDNIKIINFGIDTNYFVKKKTTTRPPCHPHRTCSPTHHTTTGHESSKNFKEDNDGTQRNQIQVQYRQKGKQKGRKETTQRRKKGQQKEKETDQRRVGTVRGST